MEKRKKKKKKMDVPVPKTIPNITNDTTHQQRQERKIRVCSREHVPLQVYNGERFKVRVENSVNKSNV
jgi:ribosome assembly protein YihI (activator of Der GTPase)